MKRLFNYIFVIIAAMVTFAGCEMSIIDESVAPETKTVQFYANSIETKTAFGTPDGTTYPTLWTENDEEVHVSMNLTSSAAYVITPSDDFKTARFKADFKDDETGNYIFYSVSPASANIQFSTSYKSYNIEIPTTQTPSSTSVDEKAQILAAKSTTYTEFPNSVSLNYSHLTAYGKLSFVNLALEEGVEINSVALTASKNFAYRYYFYPETGELQENGSTSTITINTSATSDIWFACAPVDLSGSTMDVVVNTNKGTYTKPITFTKGGNFEAGKIAKFSVDMAGISIESPEEYVLVTNSAELTEGSKVIFVGETYAMSTNQKSSNRGAAAVTLSDDKLIVSTPGTDVQIFTVEPGTKTETVAFNTGSGYIYAASSSGNQLKTKVELDDNASWSVSISEGVATVTAQGSYTRNVIRYNPNNGSPLFACYASASSTGSLVSIYKLKGSGTVLENYLNVPATIDVEAATTMAQISVKSDLAWTATVSTGASLDVTSGTGDAVVNVTFPENTSPETKTYAVTFTADGVEKVVTITQAAATPVYASLAELVAAGEPTVDGTKVTVTLTDEKITGIYTTSGGYRNGVFLQVGDKEIEIYCKNVPETWVVGGTISGTLTDCDWKLYNTTWELCPADWNELTYTAPAGGETTEPEEPGEGSGDEGNEKVWKLVTDASTLKAGDKITIVSAAKGKIISEISSQYMTQVDVTITDNQFTNLPTNAVELTLGGSVDSWTFTNSDGKLLGATAVKKLAWDNGTTTWKISVSDGDATIQNTTASYGRFLHNVSSTRFTTYTSNASSSMLLPQIYRYE